MHAHHRGFSLIETIVVLAIISILLGLLLPAIQASRERAHETVCKNNLHQLEVAMQRYVGVYKELPDPGMPDEVNGWAYAMLPYIDSGNIHDPWLIGRPLADATDLLRRPPRVMRCPSRSIQHDTQQRFEESHYLFVRGPRKTWTIFDAPLDFSAPWLVGPEASRNRVTRSTGPHNDGFYFASSSGGVRFMIGGEVIGD